MIYRRIQRDAGLGRRRGVVVLWYLLFMSTFLIAMALAMNTWRLVLAKVQQGNNTDADALAGAAILADTRLLLGDEAQIYNNVPPDLLTDAIAEIQKTSLMNFVDGTAFSVLAGDIFFGQQQLTPTLSFTAIDQASATPAQLRTINAVRIVGQRTVERKNQIPLFGNAFTGIKYAQVVTQSTAALDRYVVGFDSGPYPISPPFSPNPSPYPAIPPAGSLQVSPLFPLAVFSDPQVDPNTANADSWEKQVEGPASPKPAMGAIPYGTLTVKVHHASLSGVTANAALLKIGTTTYTELYTQMTGGVTATHFAAYKAGTGGTQFVLDSTTNQVIVDHYAGPLPATIDFDDLQFALQTAANSNACKVFPVYITYDVGGGKVTLTQFVAGKVSNVIVAKDAMNNDYLTFSLTPCLVATPTALTAPSRNAAFVPPVRRLLENLYVCRLRMCD